MKKAKISNNEAWDQIFTALPIEKEISNNGFFDITADQIKDYGHREPRLMAKIDFREQLPKVMQSKKLSLLAIKNGLYRIGPFDPFIDIAPEHKGMTQSVVFPKNILTIKAEDLAHESVMLDAAKISGVLDCVFGEKVELTVRGRSRSPDFNFNLSGVPFPISGVQVEVDGGYEGEKSINLVEAKIGGRNNISVRQLLYPQLSWEKKLSHQKQIKSYICFYQAPIIRFIPILFENGICRADHQAETGFLLESYARNFDIKSVPEDRNSLLRQQGIPFPQADDFNRIMAIFSILIASEEGKATKEELLEEFDIDFRQIDYYSNALRWLGIVSIEKGVISLTEQGEEIGKASHAEKIQFLAKIIFKNPVFHYVLHGGVCAFHSGIEACEMTRRFKACGVVALSTQERRLKTVLAWIKYFKIQTQSA